MQNTVVFKNTPIHYSDEGKGSAVVLLHGFLENRYMWDFIKEDLTKTYRVITIDLLGHGKTDCIGYVHSMELMAEVVYSVLKSIRIRRAILIGHSMGGYVSLAFAEKFPKMVKGLCLMNSTATEDDQDRKDLRARANKMVQTNFENMVRMSVANLFKPESIAAFSMEVDRVKKEALQTPIQGYIAAQEGMRIRPDRTSVVQNGPFPTFYVIAKEDPVLNSAEVTTEAKSVNAEYVVLEGGHMSHVENKEELTASLKTFLKNI
ncbi:alpha/beta hydrolase [Pseudotenacibaculum sp. MALMAid0570]|uniref:alpha/beta fold hydrolase n=1 Tax=Pseudotenacibaculum sp. MALMAid0570 TaxID=3143938 RepID=UPI0032DF7973